MIRAMFFDAGNTLIHMDYAAIATALAGQGIRRRGRRRPAGRVASPGAARRVLRRRGTSTESPDTGERYLRYLLDELGVRDAATRGRAVGVAAWLQRADRSLDGR